VERTPEDSAKPSRPRAVDRGIKLAYASLLFGIVAEVVDFRHFLALAPATDSLATFVFTYGLLLFLILKVSRGRNWARIVLLLIFLVGLGLYSVFLRDALKRNPMMVFVNIVPTLLQGAALFFWFKPSSGAWFKGGITTL